MTEVRIEQTDSGNYWRISGNIEDTSPIQSFVIAVRMGDTNIGYGISPEAIEPDGSFTISYDISENIPNTLREDISVISVQIIDESGNETLFDAAQLDAVNALIPQVNYQVNPGSANQEPEPEPNIPDDIAESQMSIIRGDDGEDTVIIDNNYIEFNLFFENDFLVIEQKSTNQKIPSVD